jgi:hypothetical protein
MESLYVLISLVIAAMLLVWITVAAVISLRRGDSLGETLKTWGRGLVDIISGIG